MKNFLIICCCIVVSNLSGQYALHSPIPDVNPIEENVTPAEKTIEYTKLTGNNCAVESGFGLSDCGFAELNEFMTKMPYPAKAYELNIEDVCTIRFTGTKEGQTENIKVSDCFVGIFQKSIVEHLSKMTWQPVIKNGEAIDFSVTFNTVFRTEL